MNRSESLALVGALSREGEGGNAPARVGVLVGFEDGRPRVDFPGNVHGPLPARALAPLGGTALRAAAAAGRAVVLLFDGGDLRRPIVLGLVEPEEAPGAPAGERDEVEVDGRRIVLEGRDEVVLRCGDASITLRRDGRVVVRGRYVETHAKGTNRVKGGTVKIN